tara:strand:+ start:3910 stop:4179 length:270 start_codon:yes stop_codon:yes gene_type:complete
MLKKVIKGVEYEIVTEFEDTGQGNAIAKTIVEDGETAENKYRLRTGTKNPLTQVPFNNNIVAFNNYISGVPDTHFNTYWEDPEPDEGGE